MSQKWRSDRVALRGLSQVNLTFPRFRSEFGRHATGASARLKGSPTKQIEFAKTARKDCSTLARSPLRGGKHIARARWSGAARSEHAFPRGRFAIPEGGQYDSVSLAPCTARRLHNHVATYQCGDRIFAEGSEGDEFFIVITGLVGLSKAGRRHPEGAASDRSRRDLWRDRRHQLCATLCVRHCARV